MKYDVVIIGAGAAGAVLGRRLAADAKTSVLLLEAAPGYPDPADLPDGIRCGHTRPSADPHSLHTRLYAGGLRHHSGYEWPPPRWRGRVALEQPGRHAHERGAHASPADAPLSQPDGAGRGVRQEDCDQGWQGRRRGSRKRGEGV